MKKALVHASTLPEYINLIPALFWMASRTFINDTWQRNLYSEYMLGQEVHLLGIDISDEIAKYKKYVNPEIKKRIENNTATEEEKNKVKECSEFIDQKYKQAWHVLEKYLAKLYWLIQDQGVRLYGTKYIKLDKSIEEDEIDFELFGDEYKYVGFEEINTDDINLQSFELTKEKLCCDVSEYRNLKVSVEDLFKLFPPTDKKLTVVQNKFTSESFVVDAATIESRNLGGRPEMLTEDDKIKLVLYIEKQGGYDWLTKKGWQKRIVDMCKKEIKTSASDETVRTFLSKVKNILKPAEK